MADFNRAYNRLKQWEGGYQANPNDPGNYNGAGELVGTNYGITAKNYEAWIGRRASIADMKNMPPMTAAAIFRSKFWDKIKGDQIRNQSVADILFDGVVNHGKGVKLAQEVLGLTADNNFGSQTFAALQAANQWAADVRDMLPEPETADLYMFLMISGIAMDDAARISDALTRRAAA